MTKRTALIVWGGWDGHTPEQSAAVVADLLEAHDFEVTIDTSTEAFSDPELGRHSLIVPILTMMHIEKDELINLTKTIRAGTGLAGFHGCMCDAFRNEPDYQFMTGGQWVAHPGNIIDFKINISAPDDPVVAGIGDFVFHSEQYYMHVDPANKVLATTTFTGEYVPEIDGVVMPVVWKRQFGAGRVFFSALGHRVEEFGVPQMKTIFERGALWAAR